MPAPTAIRALPLPGLAAPLLGTLLIGLLGAALCAPAAAAGLSARSTAVPTTQAFKLGDGCGGNCRGGGGGGTGVPGAQNPLPKTAPAPDIVYRESFGPGPDQLRPKGGKGDLRASYLHTSINGFWVEWPGSKASQWKTANGDQSWKFAGAGGNPYELPSPLQPGEGYEGVAYSEIFDVVNPVYPALLLPVTWPTGRWALSIEGAPYGSLTFGSYVALGVTDSALTTSNLSSVGKLALMLHRDLQGATRFELWSGVGGRTLLASGPMDDLTWNHMELAYDPAARLLTASLNGMTIGSYPITLGAPRYAAIEGLGLADNLVIRRLP